MSRLALFFALTLLFISPFASADIPHLISLQGRLTDATNNPLTSTANFVFRIYASQTGGTPAWTETQNSIPLDTLGIFSVLLGSANALSIPFDSSYWLEVQVQSGTGPAQILSPRTRMGSAGYALRSESPWNATGNNIFTTNTGNVGIGTTVPGARLDVKGTGAGAQKVNIQDPNGGSFAFDMQGSGVTSRAAIYIDSSAVANTEVISIPTYGATKGYVGIGTTSPSEKLDVAGAIKATGNVGYWSSFTVGGTSGNYYPVQFRNDAPGVSTSSDLMIYRSNVHTNGAWFGTFMFKVSFHPTNWGHFGSQIEKIEYLTGSGSPYNDPVGDIVDGSTSGGGDDVIVWLKGGATYEWKTMNTAGAWTLLNGNSGGTSITDSSGIVRNLITSQSTLITNAKNRFYTNTLSLGTAGTLAVDGTGNSYIQGNVGIGTGSPGAKLDVNGNTKTLGSDIFAQSDNTNTAYWAAPIQIREAQYGGSGYLPPRLSFHWAGVVASQLAIESDGAIAVRDNPGTGYEKFRAGPVQSAGSGNSYFTGGNIGIGTTGPARKLDVSGRLLVREGAIPNGWDTADWGAIASIRRPGAASMASANDGNAQLELVSDGPTTSHISFHRPGVYGANFGLDTDNWLSTQGWSAGAGYTNLRAGTIRSMSGGIQFPDGTTQTSAATSGKSNMGYIDNTGMQPFISYDAAVSSSCRSLTKLKTIKLNAIPDSNLKTYFELYATSGNCINAQVYRNGNPVGTLRGVCYPATGAYTETISGWQNGDTLELWGSTSTGDSRCGGCDWTCGTVNVQNFRVLGKLAYELS